MLSSFVQFYLAIVFARAVRGRQQKEWSSRVGALGLWTGPRARVIATSVSVGESVLAATLLVSGLWGLLLAGAALVAFGSVLAVARAIGYRGSCGCSPVGRVSWLAVARCLIWGSLATGLAVSEVSPTAHPIVVTGVTVGLQFVTSTVFIWASSARVRAATLALLASPSLAQPGGRSP